MWWLPRWPGMTCRMEELLICQNHSGHSSAGSRDKDWSINSRFQRRPRLPVAVLKEGRMFWITILKRSHDSIKTFDRRRTIGVASSSKKGKERALRLLPNQGSCSDWERRKKRFIHCFGSERRRVWFLTIGQYLQPRPDRLPVVRYVPLRSLKTIKR